MHRGHFEVLNRDSNHYTFSTRKQKDTSTHWTDHWYYFIGEEKFNVLTKNKIYYCGLNVLECYVFLAYLQNL